MSKLSKKDASLMIGFSRITNYLQREVSLLCNQHELTQTQFAILEVLYSKGELLVGEIQKLILSTPGNVPYVINNLIKKGYVIKVNVESDKRCSRISLTPAGKEKIMEILPAHDNLLTEKFELLAASEKDELLSLIFKFRNGLKEEEKR